MDSILRIMISLLPGIRLHERLLIEECISDPEVLERIGRKGVEGLIQRRLNIRCVYPDHGTHLKNAERIRRDLSRSRAFTTTYWDSSYPPQLREICDPPYLLYIRGRLPSYEVPMISIVGTRRPSVPARGAAFSLAAEFASVGIPVVSGLAFGIDAAAHWGAVKNGGATIAVLGTSIDRVYPAVHSELAGRVLESGGAIISEKPPGSRIGKYDFPLRNRIISGLSRGLVIVEAPVKSGALITAEWAAQDNRDVYVHTAGTQGCRGGGTKKLVSEGALRIDHARDILKDWNIRENPQQVVRVNTQGLHPSEIIQSELEDELLRFHGMYYRRVG